MYVVNMPLCCQLARNMLQSQCVTVVLLLSIIFKFCLVVVVRFFLLFVLFFFLAILFVESKTETAAENSLKTLICLHFFTDFLKENFKAVYP